MTFKYAFASVSSIVKLWHARRHVGIPPAGVPRVKCHSGNPDEREVAMSRIGKHACGEGSQERIVARRARAHSRAPRLPAARTAAWCRWTEGATASPLPPATLPAPVFDAINGRHNRMVEEGQHLGLAARIAPCDPDRLQKLAAIL